jgi:large subunit ribosomal protein L3
MLNGLIAKKIGMSRIFLENGEAVPVTYLQVEPNTVVRMKTEEKDGYNAVVLGIDEKKWKTRKGKEHTRYRVQKEWKVDSLEGLKSGEKVTAEAIPEKSIVTISGISKGKGFQGVVKRYGFAGGPKTHGSHFKRAPGSIGMCEFPGRVMKGKKMPGHMGKEQLTLKNRSVLVADIKKGVLAVKGPVPGANGTHVFLTMEPAPDA